MCVLIFSTTFVWSISNSKKNWTRYDKKCISVCMLSAGYCCRNLMKLTFPRQRFEKYPNIKFHKNPSSGGRVVPFGGMDGQTDMMKLIVTFRNFANSLKNSTFCLHSVFMCSVWIWEQTAIISLYSINWLVFITETKCVYCAVRTGYLSIIQVNFAFKDKKISGAHFTFSCTVYHKENNIN